MVIWVTNTLEVGLKTGISTLQPDVDGPNCGFHVFNDKNKYENTQKYGQTVLGGGLVLLQLHCTATLQTETSEPLLTI